MAEATEVRLVRCPRCGNLLTELPDFSLYKCGGCGVVLKAREKGIIDDGLSETSNDEKGGRISVECSVFDMPRIVESVDGIERVRMEKLNHRREISDDSSMYRSENMELVTDFDVNHRGKEMIRRHEYYEDKNQSYSQGLIHNRKHDGYRNFHAEQRRSDNFPYRDEGSSSYETRPQYEHGERVKYHQDRDLNARVEHLEHNRVELLKKLDELTDHLNHSLVTDHQPKERIFSPTAHDPYGRFHDVYVQEGLTSSHRANKKPFATNNLESSYSSHLHGLRPIPGSYVSGERDSYSPRGFSHQSKGYAPPLHQHHHKDIFGYSKNINHESSMLHPREQFFHESSCSCVHCYNRNFDVPHKIDHHLHEHYNPNIRHHLDPVLHVPRDDNSRGSGLHSRQSPILVSNDQEYENNGFNNFRHRKARVAHRRGRVCHPVSGGAPLLTCCNCFELLKLPRKYGSLAKKQQIKCGSCFSVLLLELGSKGNVVPVSAIVDPIPTHVSRSSNNANTDICYIKREDSQPAFPTQDKSKYNESVDNKSNHDDAVKQLDPLPTTLSTSMDKHNTDSKNMSNDDELEKHPDPFSATSDISMVKYDKDDDSKPEKQLSAFSAISSITMDKQLTVVKLSSDNPEMQVDTVSATSIASLDKLNINTYKMSNYDEPEKQFDPAFAPSNISLNKDNTDSEVNSSNDELEKQLDPISAALNSSIDEHCNNTDEKSNYDEFGKISDHLCANSSISADERLTDDLESKKDCNFPEECHDQCFENSIGSLSDKESDESKQAVPTYTQTTSRQNPANHSKMKTVTNMSGDQLSNSYRSQDSEEIHEEAHHRIDTGSKPFTVGVAKESIQEDVSNYNDSLEIEEPKVFVNSHLIRYRDVKNAEKLAGPIQPGDYWYDYRAGFWGVMGHPCLGLVMPNIEEFNYPLPEDCAAGNTGVFVNGRELHQKDLDILTSRGLPVLKYRFYSVEISGKVVDERTGEELDLGKMAPTVEREQRGFGMRVP